MNEQKQNDTATLVSDAATRKFKKDKFEHDRLWEYFKYHAKQRIETFRFFFIIASIVASGFLTFVFRNTSASSMKKHLRAVPAEYATEFNNFINISHTLLLWIMFCLGVFLIIFSIVFWLLDHRNNMMIDESRKLLIKMENDKDFENKIFIIVEENTNKNKSVRFEHCFGTIFFLYIVIGAGISIYSIYGLW